MSFNNMHEMKTKVFLQLKLSMLLNVRKKLPTVTLLCISHSQTRLKHVLEKTYPITQRVQLVRTKLGRCSERTAKIHNNSIAGE